MTRHTQEQRSYGEKMMRFGTTMLVAAGLAAGAMAACAPNVGDIDRTQPNKIDVSIFKGEWFFQPTVVHAQYNQGLIYEGAAGDADRIKWDVEKNYLVAYRSYEELINAEKTPGQTNASFKGTPVAVFKILSHFDVVRGFNAATGEQNNVITEDTTLRPWYDRQYIRVDWSQNLLNDPYTLQSGLQADSAAPFYYQGNEKDSPYRPEITKDYIDVVDNYHLRTDYGTCAAYFHDLAFCGNSNVTMRLSFVKVKPEDYQTLYYPDNIPIRHSDGTPVQNSCASDGTCTNYTLPVFERFGFFRHERVAYDNEWQWTQNGRLFVANRWNIWVQTHDANGNVIPPEYRQTKQIVYYTNVDFPDYDGPIWRAAQNLVGQWDDALRNTVLELDKKNDPSKTLADVPHIFVLKPNTCNIANVTKYAADNGYDDMLSQNGSYPVEQGNLLRSCALLEWYSKGKFTWQKEGDLRYSFLHWVDTPQIAGPLGLAQSAADPVSGRIISATANIYGAAIDSYSAYAADIVSAMNGTIDLTDVSDGELIRDHVAQAKKDILKKISPTALDAMNQFLDQHRNEFFGSTVPNARHALYDMKHSEVSRNAPAVAAADLPPTAGAAALNAVRGTSLDRELLTNDDIRRALLGPDAYQPGDVTTPNGGASIPPSSIVVGTGSSSTSSSGTSTTSSSSSSASTPSLATVSALDLLSGDAAKEHQQAAMTLAQHSIMMASPSDWTDTGMVALADQLKGRSWDEVYAYMRENIFQAVAAHEVGHTLGLRHNFGGSYDALNFQPAFWNSYTYDPATGKGTVERVATANDPLYKSGQVQVGQYTPAESNMYSSIMDYDARFYADSFQGIGPYDKAAIAFGYGNLVQVWQPGVAAVGLSTFKLLDGYQALPKLVTGDLSCTSNANCKPDVINANTAYNNYLDAYNKAQQAEVAGDQTTWAQKHAEYEQDLEQSTRLNNNYFETALNGITPAPQNLWKRQYVRFGDLEKDWTNYYDANGSVPDVVPYYFCTDEESIYNIPECQPWDKGASYREITADRMERYDAYYFFNNFRRDRYTFDDGNFALNYMNWLYSRIFSPMSMVFRYSLYSTISLGRDSSGKELTFYDFPTGQDWQGAGYDSLNYLSQVLEQPEPGNYCLQTEDQYNIVDPTTTQCAAADLSRYCTDSTGVYQPIDATATCATQERDYCRTTQKVYKPMADGDTCDPSNEINVPVGVGKYYYTNWTNEYYYKATRLGTFWDKMAALFALTDNNGLFYKDVADIFDVGAYQLSYWSGGLKQPILDVMNGVINGGTGKFAWRYDANQSGENRFVPVPAVDVYEGVPTTDYSLPKIQGASSWTLRYWGVFLPMARFNSAFDYSTDFSNYEQVCLQGYSDCMDFNTPHADYTDPLTGYHYVASWTDRPSDTVAANLLRDARLYVENNYQPAKTAVAATYDTSGNPVTNFALTQAEEDKYQCGGSYSTACDAGTMNSIAGDRESHLEDVERGINERTGFIEVVRQFSDALSMY